jgi:hypothetical protein
MENNKSIGFFLPLSDMRRLRRDRRERRDAAVHAVETHATNVAHDVASLMHVINGGTDTSVVVVADLTRQLLAQHLGDQHAAIRAALGYAAPSSESTLGKAYGSLRPVAAASGENNSLSVLLPPAFWHHLWHYIHVDYRLAAGSDVVTFVTSSKSDSEKDAAHPRSLASAGSHPSTLAMPLFAAFYRHVTKSFAMHQGDVPMAFFVASALRYKNAVETMRVALDGKGDDKGHARFRSMSGERLKSFIDYAGTLDILSAPSCVAEWTALLHFASITLPEVSIDAKETMPSTLLSLTAAAAAPDTQQPEGEAEAEAEAEGEAEGETETEEEPAGEEVKAPAAATTTPGDVKARIQARQLFEAHPAVREARVVWQVGPGAANTARLVGMLMTRQMTSVRGEREQVLRDELAFRNPEQYHAMLDRQLVRLDTTKVASVSHVHDLVRHVANHIGASMVDGTDADDVTAFTNQVFSAHGVPHSDRPVARSEQLRRYLAVYAGAGNNKEWQTVWQAQWPLSSALQRSIQARLEQVPRMPLATQQRLVRALAGTL